MMRTTVTLDAEASAVVNRLMSERGLTFKQAVNAAIVAGSRPRARAFRTPVYALGEPAVDLTHALRIAGELEDDELVRKSRVGK